MNKTIVAIGGGENGRELEDGSFSSYDTELIDSEIVKLTNKKNPNFLFLGHAMKFLPNVEKSYFHTMEKIYKDKLGCNCDQLLSSDLENKKLAEEKIEWADIIYEGGGDTTSMIDLWNKTKFSDILYKAWNNGKIICGISAGAVCWFKSCNSDSSTVNDKFSSVKCLDWLNLHITPHCNEEGRIESTKKQLKYNQLNGLLLSNSSAIEIVNDQFKIIVDNSDAKAYLAYWKNNNYYEKDITNISFFQKIEMLLNKDN